MVKAAAIVEDEEECIPDVNNGSNSEEDIH